ncbi:WEB family protein [Acorus calamus]|uniref:WEB family protein n=1 Tax=Acorus calamus TaxID=4465 RepID=A0AAV9CAT1_ACOCL|nr:WEB family protein [Acorus calamus]
MLSSRTKTGLLETPKSSLSETSNKLSPATPRVNKLGRTPSKTDPNSHSPLQNSRLSVDRSPRSADSKPTIDRRSPKISTTTDVRRPISTPDKQQRSSKGSELQAQLDSSQEDLKKLKEKLASAEKEKAQSLKELQDAKRLADEANEKLGEALAAQKRAEESLEIEKFQAVELEQAGIEATQKREEVWQKELENVRSQHAIDLTALLSSTEELQRAKQELAMNIDAKNAALTHADDAMKIAEIHAEKVEILSSEVAQLKSLLEEKAESNACEVSEMVSKLNSEVDSLKGELEKARVFGERVAEMEALVEGLKGDVSEAKRVESELGDVVDEWKKKAESLEGQVDRLSQSEKSALESLSLAKIQLEGTSKSLQEAKRVESELGNVVDEWKKKAESLEARVDELSQSEKSALESLSLVKKQLEGTSKALQDAEAEIAALKEKAESLEIAIERHRLDLEESNQSLEIARQQALEITKTVEVLQSEIQNLQEEKMQAEKNEKIAASNVQKLFEEREILLIELDMTKEEVEKNKKAMEGLASALHEVSSEARETKENLIISQVELKNAEFHIEELNSTLNDTKEKYEAQLEAVKDEMNHLEKEIERFELENENLETEWNEKERNFLNAIKTSEDEITRVKSERDETIDSLKFAEAEVRAAKEDGAGLLNKLKQADLDVGFAREAAEEAKSESLRLKERLLDRENELQSVIQENDELRSRETVALEKVKELSELLNERSSKNVEENGVDSSDGEREYHLLSRAVEVEDNEGETEELKPKPEHVKEHIEVSPLPKAQNGVGEDKEVDEEEPIEVGVKTLENGKMVDKCLSPDREARLETLEEEADSKVDSDSFDHMNGLSLETADNGGSSPSKQQQKKKKKPPIMRKLGSLLKKKSSPK